MTTPNFDDPTSEVLHFVYDVESIGLHGEAFAVAFVVFDENGAGKASNLEEKIYSCPQGVAAGRQSDFEWVDQNVPYIDVNHESPRAVRDAFWKKMRQWIEQGASVWADHVWPVDAGFLSACIADDPVERTWKGPKRLLDIETLGLRKGVERPRLEEGERAHDPLSDAKRSARYLRALLEVES